MSHKEFHYLSVCACIALLILYFTVEYNYVFLDFF